MGKVVSVSSEGKYRLRRTDTRLPLSTIASRLNIIAVSRWQGRGPYLGRDPWLSNCRTVSASCSGALEADFCQEHVHQPTWLSLRKVLCFICSGWWTQNIPCFWRLHCFVTSGSLWFLDWTFSSCRERNKKPNGLEFCFPQKYLGSTYLGYLVYCTFMPLLLIMLRWE